MEVNISLTHFIKHFGGHDSNKKQDKLLKRGIYNRACKCKSFVEPFYQTLVGKISIKNKTKNERGIYNGGWMSSFATYAFCLVIAAATEWSGSAILTGSARVKDLQIDPGG